MSIGIDPAVARKFFTDADSVLIKEKTGESLFVERFLVKITFVLDYICLLAGIIASIFALKWYSIIAVPVMLIAWFFLGSMASVGRQKIGGAVFLLIVAAMTAYLLRTEGTAMIVWIALLPLPFLFSRLTYKLATMFLRSLAVRNESAFNLLVDKGIFFRDR